MQCRFCHHGAVAVFTLSDGCACFPDDREQALCAQHIVRASPLGSMELKDVVDREMWAFMVRRGDVRDPAWAPR